MNKDNKYKSGEEITQKLFELTGDPRYHNARVGFENLKRDVQAKTQENENGREM